jgi:hypothetical protein
MKVLVKEGWVNQDTGKKSEPRIQSHVGAIFKIEAAARNYNKDTDNFSCHLYEPINTK